MSHWACWSFEMSPCSRRMLSSSADGNTSSRYTLKRERQKGEGRTDRVAVCKKRNAVRHSKVVEIARHQAALVNVDLIDIGVIAKVIHQLFQLEGTKIGKSKVENAAALLQFCRRLCACISILDSCGRSICHPGSHLPDGSKIGEKRGVERRGRPAHARRSIHSQNDDVNVGDPELTTEL